jgi:hypothetical protein
MPLVTMQAPIPNHSYATRQGTVRSDSSGLISDVPTATQLFSDLIGAGCYALPPSAPAADGDLPEPEA